MRSQLFFGRADYITDEELYGGLQVFERGLRLHEWAPQRGAMFVERLGCQKSAPQRGAMCAVDSQHVADTLHPAGVRIRSTRSLQTFNHYVVACTATRCHRGLQSVQHR